MLNISRELSEYLQSSRYCNWRAIMRFTDGEEVVLDDNDFEMGACSLSVGANSTALALGQCLTKSLTLAIYNDEDKYYNKDFFEAVINLYVDYDMTALGYGRESLYIGKFTVTEPEEYGSTIYITAYDDLYKTDTDCTVDTKNKTLRQIFAECCTECGLVADTGLFYNHDFIVDFDLSGYTYRQVLGYIAMFAGGNVVVKNDYVKIVSYADSVDAVQEIDGGFFDDGTPRYTSGIFTSAEGFNPWTDRNKLDSGTFEESKKSYVLSDAINQRMATDSVVITGVKYIEKLQNGTKEYKYPGISEYSSKYVLTLENPLFASKPQEAIDMVGRTLVKLNFRTCEVDIASYPMAEIADLCYVIDKRGTAYKTFLTDITISFHGFTTLKCSAESPKRGIYKNYYSPSLVKSAQAAREVAKTEITSHDSQTARMGELIANSMGMHFTLQESDGGGNVYFLHDKPDLDNSVNIFQINSNGFFLSTDGGTTYKSGLTASGDAVLNVLSVIGITADWIKAGTLTVGGVDNLRGKIELFNESGVLFGRINNRGIQIGSEKFMFDLSTDSLEFTDRRITPNNKGEIAATTWNNKCYGLAISLKTTGMFFSISHNSSPVMLYTPVDMFFDSGNKAYSANCFTFNTNLFAKGSISATSSINTDSSVQINNKEYRFSGTGQSFAFEKRVYTNSGYSWTKYSEITQAYIATDVINYGLSIQLKQDDSFFAITNGNTLKALYTSKLLGAYGKDKFHFYADFDLHNRQIKNAKYADHPYTGRMRVQVTNSNGGFSYADMYIIDGIVCKQDKDL